MAERYASTDAQGENILLQSLVNVKKKVASTYVPSSGTAENKAPENGGKVLAVVVTPCFHGMSSV